MNFQFTANDKRKISKTVLLLWTPDKAPAKDRFLYCSEKNALLGDFKNVQIEVQADNLEEASFNAIKDRVMLGES